MTITNISNELFKGFIETWKTFEFVDYFQPFLSNQTPWKYFFSKFLIFIFNFIIKYVFWPNFNIFEPFLAKIFLKVWRWRYLEFPVMTSSQKWLKKGCSTIEILGDFLLRYKDTIEKVWAKFQLDIIFFLQIMPGDPTTKANLKSGTALFKFCSVVLELRFGNQNSL